MKSPLADQMRPTSIDDVFGQKHLIGEGKILNKIINKKMAPNMIFYGPSGVGKTTVAKIVAENSGKELKYLNATTASISDVKDLVKTLEGKTEGVLLYLDEIQYFTKKQQQILLSFIESGEITLIAATTENPYFYVYPAIISRSTVFEFKLLSVDDLILALDRSVEKLNSERLIVTITAEAKRMIALAANGDLRKALNSLELSIALCEGEVATVDKYIVEDVVANSGMRYDREGDQHYDVISAYQKSMRGSDPDAALYYLGVLLTAGDLPSACRRLLVCANEDVGMAYPHIISIVKDAVDTALMVGLPEARLPLANAVVLVATSPKSNSTHDAINAIMMDIEKRGVGEVPRHLQNKHYDGVGADRVGQNYKYPHDYPSHYVQQQYMPDKLLGKQYYVPGQNKHEKQIAEYWRAIKSKK